jgi:hypothetical protein
MKKKTHYLMLIFIVAVGFLIVMTKPWQSYFQQTSSTASTEQAMLVNENTQTDYAKVHSPTQDAAHLYSASNKHSRADLNRMYALSREHNECQAELRAIGNQNSTLRASYNKSLIKISDPQQHFLALMYMHKLDLLDAAQTLLKIKQNHLKKKQVQFDEFLPRNRDNKPTQEQKEMMEKFSEIGMAMNTDQLQLVPYLVEEFRDISDKKGLITRRRGGRLLVSADTIVGHMLVGKPLAQIDTLLTNIDVTPQMLTQAIRSGADTQLISRMLLGFTFTNEAVFTKKTQLQTPLQAAIEVKNSEVIRLLLNQETINNDRYQYAPVNTLLYQALLRGEASWALTEEEVAILELLADYGYQAELVPIKRIRKMTLAGFPFAVLPPEMNEQLKTMKFPARVTSKVTMPSFEDLNPNVKRFFDENALLLEEGLATYRKKQKQCKPIAQTWKDNRPEQIVIDDISSYLLEGVGHSEQIAHLSKTSPVLVDYYHTDTLRQAPNIGEIDTFMLSMTSLENDLSRYKSVIEKMDLNLGQRYYLSQQLCVKFGEAGIYASFELTQFIDFTDFDDNDCLTTNPNYFREIKRDFFSHPDTFPSEAYQLLETLSSIKLTDLLKSQKLMSPNSLAGFPQGRDALMYALDRKNRTVIQSSAFDDSEVLGLLLSVTKLNEQHMRRLHRLKVVDILMFEALADKFPEIRTAENYPFDVFFSIN